MTFKKKTASMAQFVLDLSVLLNYGAVQSDVLDLLELHTREYIYKIHQKRVARLRQISQN